MAIPESAASIETLFKRYITGKRILIADGAATSRSGLLTTFQWLGARTDQMILVSQFNQAEQAIFESKPHIVVAEYDLGRRCGLDLLQKQREQRPEETKNCLFLLATGNSSQTAVARAVEEDIDAYLLKPLLPKAVCQTILRAAALKLKPTDYQREIESGKAAMSQGDLALADQHFQKASQLDPNPSLAFYYLGLTDQMRRAAEEAKTDFEKGLQYNEIHYRCLIGLYDVFRSQNENERAYEVVRKIARFFPANPKRLEEVVRLAIVTGRFADIEEYYKLFITIDERNQSLIRHVAAALVVCGKYFLLHGQMDKATALFEKAAVSGVSQTGILLGIVSALAEFKQGTCAAKFINRFPPESCDTDDFLLAKFLVTSLAKDVGPAILLGQSLIKRGLVDERLYLAMLENYCRAGLRGSAEDLIQEIAKFFPKKLARAQRIRLAYPKCA